jgi:hypothetical protein
MGDFKSLSEKELLNKIDEFHKLQSQVYRDYEDRRVQHGELQQQVYAYLDQIYYGKRNIYLGKEGKALWFKRNQEMNAHSSVVAASSDKDVAFDIDSDVNKCLSDLNRQLLDRYDGQYAPLKLPTATTPDANRNMLVVGTSGYGKSTFELRQLVDEADYANTAIVCLDPHGTLAEDLLAHLLARGHQNRILYERLSDLDPVLAWDFLTPSSATIALQREAENDVRTRDFADILTRRRDQTKDLSETPLIEEWLLPALRLYINQSEQLPLTALLHVFDSQHPTFHQMLEGCSDHDTVRKFRYLFDHPKQSPYVPAKRLLDGVCGTPALKVRCQRLPGFDLAAHLHSKGILIVDGASRGTLSDAARRTMMGSIVLKVIQYVRTRPSPLPLVTLSIDEATNAALIGASGIETSAMAECRKMGLAFHLMVQLFDFPSTDTEDKVLNNCACRVYFHCSNPKTASQAARDLAGGRQFMIKYKSAPPNDPIRGRAKLEPCLEPLEPLDRRDAEQQLRSLSVGSCFVRSGESTGKLSIERLTPPDTSTSLQHALPQIWQRPEYIHPFAQPVTANEMSSPSSTDDAIPPCEDDDDSPLDII